jgi:hypothetical protein
MSTWEGFEGHRRDQGAASSEILRDARRRAGLAGDSDALGRSQPSLISALEPAAGISRGFACIKPVLKNSVRES